MASTLRRVCDRVVYSSRLHLVALLFTLHAFERLAADALHHVERLPLRNTARDKVDQVGLQQEDRGLIHNVC